MFRKTTMAALVAAIAILGVVVVLQTGGGGADEVDATTSADIQAVFQNGGSYVLTSDVEINGGTVSSDLVLDLNGHTLTTTDSIQINARFTVNDSSSNNTGMIYASIDSDMITVGYEELSTEKAPNASLIMNSGTIVLESNINGSDTITAFEDVVINGGIIQRVGSGDEGTYALKIRDGTTTIDNASIVSVANALAVMSVSPTDDTVNYDPKCVIDDTYISAKYYGVAIFGINNMEDNDSVVLTLNNTEIVSEYTCISSNASSGIYAGFSINVNGGSLNGTYGIYAPGYGVYNLNGVSVTASIAGIQIAAGELNILGDTVIETTNVNSGTYNSLLPSTGSGPGDICGAIVVGKAGSGYVGDVDVNLVSGTLQAPEDGDALVICDNATGEDVLSNYSMSVEATGGEVDGNIVFTTAESNRTSQVKDSGMITFDLDGSKVIGNISKAKDFNGSTTVTSGTVSGDMTGDIDSSVPSGTVYFPDGTSGTYYSSFRMPSGPVSDRDGYTFLGFSLRSDATSADYEPNEVVETTGNVTVYEVWENDNPYVPFPDDDDDYVPIPPVVYEDSGDDDTVTIVACAAAAVVAAILAVFLIVERKH